MNREINLVGTIINDDSPDFVINKIDYQHRGEAINMSADDQGGEDKFFDKFGLMEECELIENTVSAVCLCGAEIEQEKFRSCLEV